MSIRSFESLGWVLEHPVPSTGWRDIRILVERRKRMGKAPDYRGWGRRVGTVGLGRTGGPRRPSSSGYMEGRGLTSRPRGWSSVRRAWFRVPAANASALAPTPGFYKDVLAASVL